MKLLFVALNNMGGEFTGGDRIWIELMKRWGKDNQIGLLGSDDALALYNKEPHPYVQPTIRNIVANIYMKIHNWKKQRHYFPKDFDYVYSVSDFLPDLIPALWHKRVCNAKWIAGYYLIAPQPFSKESPYKGINRIKGTLYWLMQCWTLYIVNRYADVVFVTSEPDRKHFTKKKVIVVRGGVDLEAMKPYINPIPVEKRTYDAIFIGRFHYQKGVLELLDIWKEVNNVKPDAKLLMVGDGPLKTEILKRKPDTVTVVGFKDGAEKYALIQDSKIVVHPATYDSGGMACAESMAFGLPAVGFDLPAYETYYPKGMLKLQSIQGFVSAIDSLLNYKPKYERYSIEAKNLIETKWDWNARARDIWQQII